MKSLTGHSIVTPAPPLIQCGSCQQKLPLRLTVEDEPAAVWLCATCQVPFVACCVRASLLQNSELIRLHERFFDVSGQPPISIAERQKAIRMASRPLNFRGDSQRRSARIAQSLVVPAVKLGPGFIPVDEPFQIMVSNLSREGIGFVHNDRVTTEHIAIELSPTSYSPIQIIVTILRQRELAAPYVELGGEFFVRLGSLPECKPQAS